MPRDLRNEREAATTMTYQANEAEQARIRRESWSNQQGRRQPVIRPPISDRAARILGWGAVLLTVVVWSALIYLTLSWRL